VHLGVDARLTSDAGEIAKADAVVLPGVGAFGACMRALRDAGLEGVARERATDGRPFLGVCVGMQMLFDGSDESPDVAGLGVLQGRVARLSGDVKLPQIGWNTLETSPGSAMFDGLPAPAWLYFVHSFAPRPVDLSIVSAWCEYGERFACAIERGSLWATQFHPEKSGATGLALLSHFVRACDIVAA
jgi:glutamine amidotransferase